MKITILGSGAVYGSPMCFNEWGDIKNISSPKNTRTRSSVLLEVEGKSILVDMGPDFRNQINTNNIKNIDAVFISHGHYDHISSLPEIQRVAHVLNKNIPVYCSLETLEEIRQSFPYMFKTRSENGSDKISWNVVEHGKTFSVLGIQFLAFGVPHGRIETTCFRYKNFAYVLDLEDLPGHSRKHLNNLDLLIIECNNGEDVVSRNHHSNLFQVKDWCEELKPKRVVLTHLSTRVDYDILSPKLPINFSLAYDGMILDL